MFLEISQNSQENTCAKAYFLIKLQSKTCNFIKKEILAQVFSCKFCEISKSNFFHRAPLVAASIFIAVLIKNCSYLSLSVVFAHNGRGAYHSYMFQKKPEQQSHLLITITQRKNVFLFSY